LKKQRVQPKRQPLIVPITLPAAKAS
jgi:hypothetical protein